MYCPAVGQIHSITLDVYTYIFCTNLSADVAPSESWRRTKINGKEKKTVGRVHRIYTDSPILHLHLIGIPL